MDVFSRKRRSEIMASVKHFDTLPEMTVRRTLHRLGYRFRLHRKDLPGRPDVVLPKWRVAVFIHGCFWHRHRNCPRASTPKSRVDYWNAKFERNVRRDRAAVAALKKAGWRVVVVWGCETRDEAKLGKRLLREISGGRRAETDGCG
jgi:DNA mismatch endonuclease (patch repair protein)